MLIAASRATNAFEGRLLRWFAVLATVAFGATVAIISHSIVGVLAALGVPLLVQRAVEHRNLVEERDRATALLAEVPRAQGGWRVEISVPVRRESTVEVEVPAAALATQATDVRVLILTTFADDAILPAWARSATSPPGVPCSTRTSSGDSSNCCAPARRRRPAGRRRPEERSRRRCLRQWRVARTLPRCCARS